MRNLRKMFRRTLLVFVLLIFVKTSFTQSPGNALDFDGSNDRVTVTTMPMTHIANFTMEAWVYPKTFTNFQTLFTYGYGDVNTGNGIGLMIDANGQLVLNFPTTGGVVNTGAILPSTNRWYHVAVTRTSGITRVYLNAVLATTTSSFNPATPTAFYLGGYNGTLYFNGRMDEFRMYNSALTATQIQSEMFTTISTLSSNLVAHYNFDNGVASANNTGITTLNDISGNSRNGTLNNFGLNGNSSNWIESYAMVVPTTTAATNVTSNGFTANWTAPTIGTLDNYLLDVSTNPSFTGPVSGSPFTVANGTTSRAITGLTSGTYYYRVRAEKASVTGQGSPSNTIAQSFDYTPPGNALNFDGSNDFVSTTNQFINPQNFTLSAWFRTTGVSSSIIGFASTQVSGLANQDRELAIDGNGKLNFFIWNGSAQNVTSPLSYNDGRYHYVAATFSSTNGMRLYVDGALVGSNASITVALNYNGWWRIGTRDQWTKGSIDQLKIYNTELNLSAIQADMFNTNANATGLVTYYNFDNGVAGANNAGLNTLTDLSGSGNTGTLQNFGLNGNSSNWVESYAMVAPTATAATNVTSNGFTANWTAPTIGIFDNYLLDVSTNPLFTGAISGSPFSVSSGTTSIAITGLISGTYYYRVRAEKSSVIGQGAPSNIVAPLISYTPPGNALDFDGSNDHVTVSSIPMTNISNFTMEGWIYPRSLTGIQNLFAYGFDNGSSGNGVSLSLVNGQLWIYHSGQAAIGTGTTIPAANTWYHVAITRTGGVTRAYLNGVVAPNTNSSAVNSPSEFRLGSFSGIRFFNGRMDEFRMYNTALTATQIQSEMFTTTSTLSSNLVAHYNFDNGVASANNAGITTLNDISGNSRNGTLNNFGLNGNSSNWVESYAMVVPTATAATNVTSNGFTANWTAPTIGIFDNYLLDVSTNPLFTGAISGSPFTVSSGTTSRAITGLISGTYYYRVRAEKSSVTGQGIPSNTISQTLAYNQPGNALDFTGLADIVTIPTMPMTNINNFTMESWICPKTFNSFSPFQTLFSYGYGDGTTGNGIGLMINMSGNLVLNMITSGGSTIVNTGATLTATNKWYHVAVTRTGGITRVYLDGILAPTTSNITPSAPTTFYLGGYNGILYFNGKMDEFRFYNTALDASQIQSDMFSFSSASSNNLVAYYDFNQGVANLNNATLTTVLDRTNNGYSGILSNSFTLNYTTSNWVESYAMVVPTATSATNVLAKSFTANWSAPVTGIVDNYFLDVSTSSTFSSFVSGYNALSVSGTSQTVTGLSPNTTYYFRVRANKESVANQGNNSNRIAVATLPCGNTSSSTNLSICSTELPYSWNGLTFNGGGAQTKTGLINAIGCDSSATLVLTIKTTSSSTTNLTICNTELPFNWNGIRTSAGTYTFITTNAAGCDSVATLNLTVKSSTSSTTNISICPSQLPYIWNGLIFNSAGSQTAILVNAVGCDSAATLNLIVKSSTTSTTNISICPSQLPYSWNGNRTSAGTFTFITTNAAGCDSTATLNLTVKSNSSSTIHSVIFTSQLPYTWNGLIFNAAGTQTKTGLINAEGCDSSATLILSVSNQLSISGSNNVCLGAQIQLSSNFSGGTWSSATPSRATVNSQGIVNGLNVGIAAIQYTLGNQTATYTVTINSIPSVPNIAYGVGGTNPQTGAPLGSYCRNRNFNLIGFPAGGSWSSSGVASVNNQGNVTLGNTLGFGSITYTFTNSNGCSNNRTLSGNVVACALRSTEEVSKNAKFLVYPNPAKNVVNIKVDNLVGKGEIIFTDLLGKQIKHQLLSLGNNTIDISNLAKGMYLVKIIADNVNETKKLIIE